MMPGDRFTRDVEVVLADAVRGALDHNGVRLAPAVERRLVGHVLDHLGGAGWTLARTADLYDWPDDYGEMF